MKIIKLNSKLTKKEFYMYVYQNEDFRSDLKYMFKLDKLKLKDFTFFLYDEIYSHNDDNSIIEIYISYNQGELKKYLYHVDWR